MPTSHVVRIVPDKQFGFIKGLGKDEDYFFHRDDYDSNFETLRNDIKTRKVEVEFEVEEREKGLRAVNVRRV